MRLKIKGRYVGVLCKWILNIFINFFKLLFKIVLKLIGLPFHGLDLWKHNDDLDDIIVQNESVNISDELNKDDCPEFDEIFDIDEDTILGVEYLIRNPDETALLRIVGQESFSKQFKRKVYSDFRGKYIKIDREKLYLKKAKVRLD